MAWSRIWGCRSLVYNLHRRSPLAYKILRVCRLLLSRMAYIPPVYMLQMMVYIHQVCKLQMVYILQVCMLQMAYTPPVCMLQMVVYILQRVCTLQVYMLLVYNHTHHLLLLQPHHPTIEDEKIQCLGKIVYITIFPEEAALSMGLLALEGCLISAGTLGTGTDGPGALGGGGGAGLGGGGGGGGAALGAGTPPPCSPECPFPRVS